MITLHNAILALNRAIITVRGDIAYDKNEQEVAYNKDAAEAKLIELQAQEAQAKQAAIDAKASALAKLAALGLTQDEIKTLIGM